ncbi:MAG: hypothetical protein KBH81_02265 [Phycisphaerae bacterium]|jgi:hypothetical protein|nr:hypothetical protein [Phycisphaerae bacterium]HRS26909.1 hypothetical protein [Phycisphaerae bacterium]
MARSITAALQQIKHELNTHVTPADIQAACRAVGHITGFGVASFNVLAAPAVGVLVGVVARCCERRRRRVTPIACNNCGYDLTGNTSGRCPECGCVTESLRNEECEVGPTDQTLETFRGPI